MWDRSDAKSAARDRPAVTLVCEVSGGERQHRRHTKRATTAKLGALQRRIILNLFNSIWDKARDEHGGVLDAVWVRWRPKEHVDQVSSASSAAVSKALAALESRRLVAVRRHPGGRAHTVTLSDAGFDCAMAMLDGTYAAAQRRSRIRGQMPAKLRRAVMGFYAELRSGKADDDRRRKLRRFTDMYRMYVTDADADAGLLEELIALLDDLSY